MALIEDVQKTDVIYIGLLRIDKDKMSYKIIETDYNVSVKLVLKENANSHPFRFREITVHKPVTSTHDIRWIIACLYND